MLVERSFSEARDTLRAMLRRELGAYNKQGSDTYGGSNDDAGDPLGSREPLPYLEPTIPLDGDNPFPGLEKPLR